MAKSSPIRLPKGELATFCARWNVTYISAVDSTPTRHYPPNTEVSIEAHLPDEPFEEGHLLETLLEMALEMETMLEHIEDS